MKLSILYRGPLGSCNYRCAYCPFAKRASSEDELRADQAALERFVRWAKGAREHQLSILFTPWGEALVRRWYREALVELSHAAHIERVAIQTNLSAHPRWAEKADRRTLALWTTFHPTQVPYDVFLERCKAMDAIGLRYSVGVVAAPEHYRAAARLRADLSDDVYLWLNAYEKGALYDYTADEARALRAIDPLFELSRRAHDSAGKRCFAGELSLSVDGEGVVRRCHFVDPPLGNLYQEPIESMLRPRTCPNAKCDCHIGYVHLEELRLYELFGEGLMERIPKDRVWRDRR